MTNLRNHQLTKNEFSRLVKDEAWASVAGLGSLSNMGTDSRVSNLTKRVYSEEELERRVEYKVNKILEKIEDKIQEANEDIKNPEYQDLSTIRVINEGKKLAFKQIKQFIEKEIK